MRFSDLEPLTASHRVDAFDCGVPSLNRWLIEHALQAQGARSARIRVARRLEDDRVIAYHAMAMASIEHAEATERATARMPQYPIPAVLLARLAIHLDVQGEGLGGWLLNDALRRALTASDEIAARVILVHAIDDGAASFYRHFGFEQSPTDAHNLQLLVKDARKALNEAG